MLLIILFSLLSLLMGYDEAKIVFAGDAMMHQAQIDAAKQRDGTYDYSEYFENISQYVADADYAVVNLETPTSKPPYSGYPCFNAPESYLDALSDAGFDLFLTANNHVLDRRDQGVVKTIEALDRRYLDHIGSYVDSTHRAGVMPFVKNINNIKVGFVNYTYGTNGFKPGKNVVIDYIDKEQIRHDVEKTRAAGAEIIIACIHWGNEYQLLPHSTQKSLADFLQKLGVEAIIGGHPHVIQPMEFKLTPTVTPRVLVYSLGNFISNMKTTDTRGGALFKLTIRRGVDGVARIADASYRLVFTEPATPTNNFRLQWVDLSTDYRASKFAKSARNIFKKYNVGVDEDLKNMAPSQNHD